MQRTPFSDFACSVARTLDVVGEWWTPLILRDVFLGVSRFDKIQEDLSIPRKVLAARLTSLVENGVLERRPYRDGRIRHEYHMTERGRDFVTTLVALMNWGDKWIPLPAGQPIHAVHTGCGGDLEVRMICTTCGAAVTSGGVHGEAGSGALGIRGTAFVARAYPQPGQQKSPAD